MTDTDTDTDRADAIRAITEQATTRPADPTERIDHLTTDVSEFLADWRAGRITATTALTAIADVITEPHLDTPGVAVARGQDPNVAWWTIHFAVAAATTALAIEWVEADDGHDLNLFTPSTTWRVAVHRPAPATPVD